MAAEADKKGTSQDEVMSSSEEIKPIGLSIIELCLAEGISQLVSQSRHTVVCRAAQEAVASY